LLTSGRTELQQRARSLAQQRLDAYRSGLEIVSIDLQEIAPPGDVARAFRDVASAAEEKNKLINDAQGYATASPLRHVARPRNGCARLKATGTDVVNRAGGEAQRFADVLAQYQRDAQIYGQGVTRYRLYVETMEKILLKARKYIVEPGENGQVNVRILDQLPAAPSQPGSRP